MIIHRTRTAVNHANVMIDMLGGSGFKKNLDIVAEELSLLISRLWWLIRLDTELSQTTKFEL